MIDFSFVVVELPDDIDFPNKFEDLVQYIRDEELEEKIDYAADQMID